MDGHADYNYTLQPSDKAGNYTLTALFSADKYDDTTKDSDVVVLKGDIADVIIPDKTIESLTNVTVDVQLNDTNGNPIYGNSTVDVVIDGKVVENVTITDGKLNITIPTDTQPAGEHNITIIIRENENYNNKTIDMKVTIIKRDVTIDIVKNDTKTLNMVNATVTVKDVNGSLVNGGKVGFKIKV